ncbi:hypothetical protein [Polaribacter sargassicola]|uniref:hypothetical protein n=1 Tax=Polaribacter sargassicola TaxID=2836891 RepID=UPI001F3AB411|nr:hypothetical protein [Polaribacter sp. DS7-9]MCG1036084.1 hypothetical protein [Polaribacter sp. DS7-9]
MKKNYIIICAFLIITSCGSPIKITDYKPNKYKVAKINQDTIFVPKPTRVSTYSKKGSYPFIHINGFKSYEINKSRAVKTRDSIFANELKFYATYSSFYTRQSMYEKFGNWDKNLFLKGQRTPFLIWEKVKLFSDKEKYYTVIAGGFECTTCNPSLETIYSSIIILDENKNDCLSDQNPELKKEILAFFSEGIKNLTNSKEFHNKFWELVLD